LRLFQLFDVVYREETLLNVIRSVTRNGRSIILTAVLALILVYMFSIIGFIFFQDDFLVEVEPYEGSVPELPSSCPADGVGCTAAAESIFNASDADKEDGSKERACDSLIMCIVTTMNQGLRNGGGIGDILRPPSSKVIRNYLTVSAS
jgi:putative methionine-R-sulfoxide reductase with GAF domain